MDIFKTRHIYLLPILTLLLLASCAKKYDISGDNLDRNIKIGGDSFSLPLGYTDTLRVDKLIQIDKIDMLKIDENGNYFMAINQAFSMNASFADYMESLRMNGINHSTRLSYTVPMVLSSYGERSSSSVKIPIPLSEQFDFIISFEEAKSNGIVDIDSISFVNAAIKTNIKINGASFPNDMYITFSFEVPKRYPIRGDSRSNNNIVTFEGKLVDGEVVFDPLSVNVAKFDDLNVNGEWVFRDKFLINNMFITVSSGNVLSLLGKTLNISIDTKLNDLSPDMFYGKIGKTLDRIDQMIDLSSIPELLKKEGVVLDFYSPNLSVILKSNVGIPINGMTTITPIIGNQRIEQNAISFNMGFPMSIDPNKDMVSKYWIASSKSGAPADFTFIEKNISSLIKKIPDAINLSVVPSTDISVQHILDCNAIYKLSANCNFVIPFAFGKDLSISFSDTLANLPDMFGKLLSSSEILLGGEVENTIPLQMELSVALLDGNNNPINITSNKQIIKAPVQSGVPVKTPLSLSIKGNKTAINGKKLVVNFKAVSGEVEGLPLNSKSYLRAVLNAKIPGGVEIEIPKQ